MNIVVTSPSFSKNKTLQKKIYKHFPSAKLNLEGKRFNKDELIKYIANADGIIVGLEEIDKEILEKCSSLQIISKYGVGLNNIALAECESKNISIGWTGGVNKLSVAELTVGFMLMLCRNLFITSNQLKRGLWNKSGGVQLSQKKIGLIGIGHIGKEVIRLLKPFNCDIYVNDIIDQKSFYKENNLKEVSIEKIFKDCDIISLHTPLDSSTSNMIDIEVFKKMKREAFLINSARGGLVNEKDLKFALENSLISGAAIDSYIHEPPVNEELLGLENLICTPHIGGNSEEAILSMGISAIEHLVEFFKK